MGLRPFTLVHTLDALLRGTGVYQAILSIPFTSALSLLGASWLGPSASGRRTYRASCWAEDLARPAGGAANQDGRGAFDEAQAALDACLLLLKVCGSSLVEVRCWGCGAECRECTTEEDE